MRKIQIADVGLRVHIIGIWIKYYLPSGSPPEFSRRRGSSVGPRSSSASWRTRPAGPAEAFFASSTLAWAVAICYTSHPAGKILFVCAAGS